MRKQPSTDPFNARMYVPQLNSDIPENTVEELAAMRRMIPADLLPILGVRP